MLVLFKGCIVHGIIHQGRDTDLGAVYQDALIGRILLDARSYLGRYVPWVPSLSYFTLKCRAVSFNTSGSIHRVKLNFLLLAFLACA